MRFHFIAVVVCAFALSGCSLLGIETCGLGSTRCKSNVVQVCKTGLGWTDSISCDEVSAGEGGKWTCGAPKGVCQESVMCMPEKSESREKAEPERKPDKSDKDRSEKAEKKESPRGSR